MIDHGHGAGEHERLDEQLYKTSLCAGAIAHVIVSRSSTGSSARFVSSFIAAWMRMQTCKTESSQNGKSSAGSSTKFSATSISAQCRTTSGLLPPSTPQSKNFSKHLSDLEGHSADLQGMILGP